MNALGFLHLIRLIYGNRPPDPATIERMGLLAVKIGQTYALRPDFLSEETCRNLGRLYRDTAPVSPAAVATLLRRHTDEAWRREVTHVEPLPLASASVGQVHRGRLRDGREVVVKLIKSDFREPFLRDVRSLRRLLRVALLVYRKLQRVADPLGVLDAIERGTLAELDLRQEVAGQDCLRQIRDREGRRFDLTRLRFPQLHRELSNSQVMVSEYLPGETLDRLLNRGELSYRTLLELFRIQGFYIFCAGTFHGDIHPGNLVLGSDGALAFLDTGVIGHVGPRMRTGLFAFFDALSRDAYEECAEALHAMAERPLDDAAWRRFRERFCALYADFSGTPVCRLSLTRRMMQTIRLGVDSGMAFEQGIYPVIKSLMYLDGMVLRCNPEAVVARDMRPFLEEFKGVS
ncbi:MAG: AarF/ABC1/UbiB kinase family protein [Lentisphaeria bacterium]|nr:AarF/ABC1/UbiB kinase family protein [Lentisphaeria bacterium]